MISLHDHETRSIGDTPRMQTISHQYQDHRDPRAPATIRGIFTTDTTSVLTRTGMKIGQIGSVSAHGVLSSAIVTKTPTALDSREVPLRHTANAPVSGHWSTHNIINKSKNTGTPLKIHCILRNFLIFILTTRTDTPVSRLLSRSISVASSTLTQTSCCSILANFPITVTASHFVVPVSRLSRQSIRQTSLGIFPLRALDVRTFSFPSLSFVPLLLKYAGHHSPTPQTQWVQGIFEATSDHLHAKQYDSQKKVNYQVPPLHTEITVKTYFMPSSLHECWCALMNNHWNCTYLLLTTNLLRCMHIYETLHTRFQVQPVQCGQWTYFQQPCKNKQHQPLRNSPGNSRPVLLCKLLSKTLYFMSWIQIPCVRNTK